MQPNWKVNLTRRITEMPNQETIQSKVLKRRGRPGQEGKSPKRKTPSQVLAERKEARGEGRTAGQELTAEVLDVMGRGLEGNRSSVGKALNSVVSGATIGMKMGEALKKYKTRKRKETLGRATTTFGSTE